MAPSRRYSLHLVLTHVLLLLVAISFWTFWSLRDVSWTFLGFLSALLIPGLLYYCTAVLVPENPDDILSWRDHYFTVHRRLYAGLGAWGVGAALSATLNLGMPLDHPARFVHITTFSIGIIGATTPNPRVHAGLVAAMAVLMLTATGVQLEPDWLNRP